MLLELFGLWFWAQVFPALHNNSSRDNIILAISFVAQEEVAHEAETGKIYRSNYIDKHGRAVLVMRPSFEVPSGFLFAYCKVAISLLSMKLYSEVMFLNHCETFTYLSQSSAIPIHQYCGLSPCVGHTSLRFGAGITGAYYHCSLCYASFQICQNAECLIDTCCKKKYIGQ